MNHVVIDSLCQNKELSLKQFSFWGIFTFFLLWHIFFGCKYSKWLWLVRSNYHFLFF